MKTSQDDSIIIFTSAAHDEYGIPFVPAVGDNDKRALDAHSMIYATWLGIDIWKLMFAVNLIDDFDRALTHTDGKPTRHFW